MHASCFKRTMEVDPVELIKGPTPRHWLRIVRTTRASKTSGELRGSPNNQATYEEVRRSQTKYESCQRSSHKSIELRKTRRARSNSGESQRSPQTFEEPGTALKTHRIKETPGANQGTVKNSNKPLRNPRSLAELITKYVALGIHAGRLRRSLEGDPVGLLIGAKTRRLFCS